MTISALFIGGFVLVTASVSAYLIGFSKGRKGQKEVIKHIYIQESKEVKKRGFAPNQEELKNNFTNKKRYTIN